MLDKLNLKFTVFLRKLRNKKYIFFTTLVIFVISFIKYRIDFFVKNIFSDKYMFLNVYKYISMAMYIVLLLVMLLIIFTELKKNKHSSLFHRIGLYNNVMVAPELIYSEKNKKTLIFEYYSSGVTKDGFIKRKKEIENVLNITITQVKEGKYKNHIIIKGLKGKIELPSIINWNDKYIPKSENLINLGKMIDDYLYVDLDKTAHFQVGGSTGSGKTVLMKNVIYQMMIKNNDIYIIDFKGGVDFPYTLRDKAVCFIEDKYEFEKSLISIIEIINSRKKEFVKIGAKNITEYNKLSENKIKRIFICCDEIAYGFDKKGLTGYEKEITESIISKVSFIAQQARFAGVHLWLSTQRGDAETIPAQIRSNLSYKICGNANEILSKITVDNDLANEITNDQKGRFVTNERIYFQGFYMDDELW